MSSIGQILSTISVRVNEIKKKYSDSVQAVLALDEVLSYLRQYDNTEAISNNENFSMAISVSDSTFSFMDLGEYSPRELSDINNETIAAIRKKSQSLELDYSKYNIEKITELQKFISRFLLRKRFSDIVRGAYNNSELKPFAKRNEIWREILSTETSYVDSLLLLEKHYAYPLREKIGTPEEIIDKKDYNSIFSNIQLILKFNSGFLNELKNLTKEWPSKTSIGAVFVDHLPYIKLYTQYVNNFSNSIYVRQNHKSNKKFQAFNLGNQHILKGITLSNLLIIPIQRVPRYKMLLECLLKVTPNNHVDYNKLKDSFEMISEITNDLDECKLKAENLEKISNIFDQISDLPPSLEIYKGGRKFIREGPIKRKNKKSKRYLYLFNDILVITFMSNPNNDSIKTFEEFVNLEFASISDVANSISFMICESKRKIKFCPTTNGEKMSWILDISGAIENIKRPAMKNAPVIGNLTRLRSATLIPSGPSSPRSIHREEIQIRDA